MMNLKDIFHHFKNKEQFIDEGNEFSGDLLIKAIKADFEKSHEKDLLEIIINAHQLCRLSETGETAFFLLICQLLEKKNYEFILKLYHAASSNLKKEIEHAIGLFSPTPSILKEINAKNVSIVEDLKEAIFNQNLSAVENLLESISKNCIFGPFFYNGLSKQVLNACKKDKKGLDKVADYLDSNETKIDHSLSPSGLFHYHLDSQSYAATQETAPQQELPQSYSDVAFREIPTGLCIAMINKGKQNLPNTFHAFFDHFQKINMKNEARYQIDFNHFMLKHICSIINLYELMDDDLFLFMKKMVKTSTQNLERFFNNFNYIPPKYFPILKRLGQDFKLEKIKNNPSLYDQLLISISSLEIEMRELPAEANVTVFQEDDSNYLTNLNTLVTRSSITLAELLLFFNQKLQISFKKVLALPEHVQLDLSVFDKEPDLLLRLMVGRHHLKNHRLKCVFDKCVEYDLRIDKDFNFFAYSLDQPDELGNRLAKHNEKIKLELNTANIDINLTFNYHKKSAFCCNPNGGIDRESLASTVYSDLINLENLLKSENETTLIRSILTCVTKIKNQVTKGKQINLKPLYNGSLDPLLQKISIQLNELSSPEELSNEIKEHSTHFQKHYADLKEEVSQISLNKIKKKATNKAFYIIPWDKNQLHTFLLGDYLSCCLAPDGGRFQAIVQRRMDAAMMMHVVYDEELQKPVCGNWLFFAKNKNNPNEIFVVANFFEIKAGYGLNKQLRDQLVQELLDYTGKYAQLIGAKGFLIRPLTYGLIPDFKEKFELENIEIEKVGGFFSPLSLDDDEVEADTYYLDSLNLDSFYRYEPPKAKQEKLPSIFFVKSLTVNQSQEYCKLPIDLQTVSDQDFDAINIQRISFS